MSLADDLLQAADLLVGEGRGTTKQARLRRALSTAYYAVFHALCEFVATGLVGGNTKEAPQRARAQVYRALDHHKAKTRLKSLFQNGRFRTDLRFPQAVETFAVAFENLQEERHRADYDPLAKFGRGEVRLLIDEAKAAVDCLRKIRGKHQAALAVWVMFDHRPGRAADGTRKSRP
ncbi:MAG: hypothetical protein ACK4PG_12170 [Acetobacteraceae bacterium]